MENEKTTAPALGEDTLTAVRTLVEEGMETLRGEFARRMEVAALPDDERERGTLKLRAEELDARERTLLRRELRTAAVEALTLRGLPAALADAVPLDSEASCRRGVDAVEKVYRNAVREGVEARLRAATPTAAPPTRSADEMSDEEYFAAAMSTL